MAELYSLEGIIISEGDNVVVEYDKPVAGGDITETLSIQIHHNQKDLASKIIGNSVRFYILSCPNLQNGGEYEDFAIIEDPESRKRIADAMESLKGKKPLFRSLNEHATEMLKNTDLSVINKKVDLINEISVYVDEQIGLGKIKPHQKSWFESVCMYWYEKGNSK